MGQCNLYIQAANDPMIKKTIEIYRHDVCEPNLTELKVILENGNYRLPAEYNAITESKSVWELGTIPTYAMNDRQILLGFIFSTEGFMNLWNMGANHSYRAEVRDAFLRNYHRANRWHLAFHAMAENLGFIEPQPLIH
jgi:lipopolysaccharide biosynthesis glycosyltransferase